MPKQRVKINRSKLLRLYRVKNRSASQVAIILGCSDTTIRNYLKKYGWRIKRQSEVMRGRKLTEEHKQKVVINLPNIKV